jgi:hypothetical protein
MGMTVDPVGGDFAQAQLPEETAPATPTIMDEEAPALPEATRGNDARMLNPDPPQPSPLVGEPNSRERKVAYARQRLAKLGLQDDEGVWSNHLADLFDAKILSNQMKANKAHTVGAISSFIPALTRVHAMGRGLAAQNNMMKQYEAEAKAKGIDLTEDPHYLTMKRQAAFGQQKYMQQLEAVDQMYDALQKDGIDFGQEGTITPLSVRMLLSDIKSGVKKLGPGKAKGAPGGAGSMAASGEVADAGSGAEGEGTPVDTDGDGLPDVLMPDEFLAMNQ